MTRPEILLVDDERDILDLGLAALNEAGFVVQTAVSGDIAMILMEQGLLFDLLITDVIMPGMLDGFALATKARRLIPSLPIVYATGYSHVTDARTRGAPEGRMLIKPWLRSDLLQAVAGALITEH
jgi:CheY-like chemotaxis protein